MLRMLYEMRCVQNTSRVSYQRMCDALEDAQDADDGQVEGGGQILGRDRGRARIRARMSARAMRWRMPMTRTVPRSKAARWV